GPTSLIPFVNLERARTHQCSTSRTTRRLRSAFRLTAGERLNLRRRPGGLQISRGLLRLAAFAFGLGMALPTLAQTIGGSPLSIAGQSSLQGDVVMCSGRPWIDVRCNGAAGDGDRDDTAAINSTIANAITSGWPVYLPAGT